MRFRRFYLSPAFIITVLLINLTWPLAAQVNTAALVGRVLDSSGAALPGAKITARHVPTGTLRWAAAAQDGSYQIRSLPTGAYEVTVEAPGFKTEVRGGITLAVGENARLEFTLSPGPITERISVVAEAPLVNTVTPELGVVIDPKRVVDLPLNGRDVMQLVGLEPGAQAQTARGKSFAFNGLSQYGVNITMDGTDVTFIETQTLGELSRVSLLNTVALESVAEIKVQTGTFSADIGRASSAGINVISRSGTNNLHGALFEFIRNDALDARSFFAATKSPLRQNQFGGNLGGPIKKNKLFFFGTYEGVRRRIGQLITGTVPTADFRARAPAIFKPMLDRIPLPTQIVDANTGISRRNDVLIDNGNVGTVKIDHTTGRFLTFVRYTINKSQNDQPLLPLQNRLVYPGTNQVVTLSSTAIISPTSLNELRIGFNRWLLPRHNTTFDNGLGWLGISGALGGVSEGKLQWADNAYTWADNYSKRLARHNLKAGLEVRRIQTNRIQQERPRFNYNSIADFMANKVLNVRLIFGTGGIGYRQTQTGLFVQDDFQVARRVMLNLGLRYEYYTPFTEVAGRLFNVVSDPLGPWRSRGDAPYAADRNNFNPRLGLSWDTTGKQKTVIRAGFGVFSSPVPPWFIFDQAAIDPGVPFAFDATPSDIPGLAYPLNPELQAALNNPMLALQLGWVPKVVGRRVLPGNLRDTYSLQWNFSVQQQITTNWAVQATYVGNQHLKTPGMRTTNLINPATRLRTDPTVADITVVETSGHRNYNALQLSLKKRLSHGFSADVFYTYSHSLVYAGQEDASIQDFNNIAGSRGPANTDVRHVLTFNYSYKLPFDRLANGAALKKVLDGWSVQGISRAASAGPITIMSGRDIRGDGTSNQRVNYVSGSQYADQQTLSQWYNKAAFALPSAGQFGNIGVNTARGRGSFNIDLSVIKRIPIREKQEIQFRAEAFSLPNSPIFGNPTSTFTSSTFGLTTTAGGSRQMQFGLRYEF
jgi:hypothetical protein